MYYYTVNGWTKEMMKAQIRLRNNGTVSMGSNGCSYRGKDNNACAIGCFIPDSEYTASMDEGGFPSFDLFGAFPNLPRVMPLVPHGMMRLQYIHDKAASDLDTRNLLCDWIDNNVGDRG